MKDNELSELELRRYSRQIKLSEIGMEGQLKLKKSKVLVIGAGGLGTPALQYLAAAGVGTIGICDNDYVDETNFHRQIMYGASDLGKLKTIVAKEKLHLLNPLVHYEIVNILVNIDNVVNIIENYDLILDCSNNYLTHNVLSEGCKALTKPLIISEVKIFEGRIIALNYESEPGLPIFTTDHSWNTQKVDELGVLGVIPGIMGSIQTNEAIKTILSIGKPLSGKVLVFDGLSNSFNIKDL
jgi:sulfur-carrier protein adenylyltransferase/sulfurtransferase